MFYNSPMVFPDGVIRDTRKLAVCGVDFSFRSRKKRSAELLLKPTLMRSNADFPQSLCRGDLWSPVLYHQYIIPHYITPMIILLVILLSPKISQNTQLNINV